MNKPLTRTLLIGCLLASSSHVLADPELNRCLATNTASNRYEICYGQMRSRAYEQRKMERKARTDAIMKQIEAEKEAAKEREARGEATGAAPTPAPRPLEQPKVTQPTPKPKPEVRPNVVPLDSPTQSILGEPKKARTIFDQPASAQPKQEATQPTTPDKADRGTQVIPSSDPNAKSGSKTKPASPIQYY